MRPLDMPVDGGSLPGEGIAMELLPRARKTASGLCQQFQTPFSAI